MDSLETDGNLSTPLMELVRVKLPWLIEERGFRIVSADYDPKHFGDSIVVLHSCTMRLRFVRDRGQIMIELGSPAEAGTWWDFYEVLKVLCIEFDKPRFILDVLAPELRVHFDALGEAIGPKLAETRVEIYHRRQERLEALKSRPPERPATARVRWWGRILKLFRLG